MLYRQNPTVLNEKIAHLTNLSIQGKITTIFKEKSKFKK